MLLEASHTAAGGEVVRQFLTVSSLLNPEGSGYLSIKAGPNAVWQATSTFSAPHGRAARLVSRVIENGPSSAGRRAEKKRRRAAEDAVSCPGRLMSTTRASTTCEMVFVHDVPLYLRVLVVEARPGVSRSSSPEQNCRPR